MGHSRRSLVIALMIVGSLGLSVWLVSLVPKDRHASAVSESASKDVPARVEPLKGTNVKRVILSQKAAERVGIETVAVRDEQVSGTRRKVVPYTAILYGTRGETWAYTNPEPLVFVRQSIRVERIEGDQAILSEGPPDGTSVVVVGADELLGAEFGVGGEQD
jgi:hypothetical protein